jgi:hypothetical protein
MMPSPMRADRQPTSSASRESRLPLGAPGAATIWSTHRRRSSSSKKWAFRPKGRLCAGCLNTPEPGAVVTAGARNWEKDTTMTQAKKATSGSRRRRQAVAGQRRNDIRLTLADHEKATFKAAADAAGMAVAAWLARAGMDQATGLAMPASTALRTALAELESAGRQAGRIGHMLNRLVIALEAGGRPGEAATRVIPLCRRAVARVDEAVLAVIDALP